MVSFKLTALAIAALHTCFTIAQIPEGLSPEDVPEIPIGEDKSLPATLNVDIRTSFPSSEIFGVKLVNGLPTRAVLDVSNNEPAPIEVMIVGGSLLTPIGIPGAPSPPVIVRNLTSTNFAVVVPAGEKETITYTFATELHPRDLTLQLVAVLRGESGNIFTKSVYNETVSVVEAPVSIFDPQIIFLYLFLAAAFGGTIYFIYTTWIPTLFPQKRRGGSSGLGGKGGERARKSTGGSKRVDPSEQIDVVGADGPATTSASASGYDESWIPASHLKRPEPRRVGSGKPKSRAA